MWLRRVALAGAGAIIVVAWGTVWYLSGWAVTADSGAVGRCPREMPLWSWAGLIAGLAMVGLSLRRPPYAPGHCARCGYDLTGNTSGRCPECGQAL